MKRVKKIVCVSVPVLVILAIGIIVKNFIIKDNNQKEIELLHASWTYNYEDIEEISQSSDIIALVKVRGVEKSYEEYGIPFTNYLVDVITPILNVNKEETFTIVMTGRETEDKIYEVADDPLLKLKEEYLIFCKMNSDGTYQILSGPQGRLTHSNGKLNSLNVINSRVREVNPYSNITINNADADELISEIKSYIASK